MNKIIKIIFLITSTFCIFITNSYSATGAADVYKITMRKVEYALVAQELQIVKMQLLLGQGIKLLI